MSTEKSQPTKTAMTADPLLVAGYCWHGEPVKVQFGYCKIFENKEKPLWWYNYECQQNAPHTFALIEAIKITTKSGEQFVNANHYGIGIYKLLKGGWPNCTHFSLPLESFEVSKMACYKIEKFDSIGFSKYEAERNKWQKENYPLEFEKMESLRRVIDKARS